MKTLPLSLHLVLFVLVAITLLFSAGDKDVAVVIKVKGEAQIKSENGKWENLKLGRRLISGDVVKTGTTSLVAIVFTDDKSMLKIRSSSEFKVEGERDEKGIKKKLSMGVGQLWAKINPKGSGFRMVTPSGVAAVRGTEFYAIVDSEGRTTLIGIEGIVELINELGRILVSEGQTGFLEKDIKPSSEQTKTFDDWAESDETGGNWIEIEFENDDGTKKKLRINYQEENE